LHIDLSTPFPACKAMKLNYENRGNEESNSQTISFKYNEYFFNETQETQSQSTDELFTYKQTMNAKTNIVVMGFTDETLTQNYKYNYNSGAAKGEINYNSKDGNTNDNESMKIEFNYQPWKILQVKGSLVNSALQLPKTDFGLKIVLDSTTNIQISALANKTKLSAELKKGDDKYAAIIKSNIPMFEKAEVQFLKRVKRGVIRFDVQVKVNGTQKAKGYISYNSQKVVIDFAVLELIDQKCIVELLDKSSDRKHVKLTTEGTHSNITIEVKYQSSRYPQLKDIVATAKGKSLIFGQIDVDLSAKLEIKSIPLPRTKIGQEAQFEMKFSGSQNESQKQVWKFNGKVSKIDDVFGKSEVDAQVTVISPLIPKIEISTVVSLNTQKPSIDFDAKLDVEQAFSYSMGLTFEVDPANSKGNLRLEAKGGDQSFKVLAEVDSYKFVKLEIDVLGKQIAMVSKHEITSPVEFSVNAQLMLPIAFAKNYQLSLVTMQRDEIVDMKGKVNWDNEEITMHGQFSPADMKIEVKTPFEKYNHLEFERVPNGNGMVTTLTFGPHQMTLNELLVFTSNAHEIDVLFQSSFLDKLMFKFSEAEQLAKFTIKKGSDHLCTDINYGYSSEQLKLVVEVRSNFIRGDKIGLIVEQSQIEHTLKVILSRGEETVLELMMKSPSGLTSSSGTVQVSLKTQRPLKPMSAEINVTYKNKEMSTSAELQATVNGKSFKITLAKGETPLLQLKIEANGIRYLEAIVINENGHFRLEIWNDSNENRVEFEYVLDDEGGFGMEFELIHGGQELLDFSMKCEFNLSEQELLSKFKLKDIGSLTLQAKAEDGQVLADIKSSFDAFKHIKVRGQWEVIPNGHRFNAVGDIDSIGYSLNFDYQYKPKDSLVLNWRAEKGSKFIHFESEMAKSGTNINGMVSVKSSEFSSSSVKFGMTTEASKVDARLTIKTPLQNMQNINSRFMLDFSPNKKGIVVYVEKICHITAVYGREGKEIDFDVTLSVPALGLKKNAIELKFSPLVWTASKKSFETKARVTVENVSHGMQLNFEADDGFNTRVVVSVAGFGQDMTFDMGSKIKTEAGVKYAKVYLNNNELVIKKQSDSLTLDIHVDIPLKLIDLGTLDVNLMYLNNQSFTLNIKSSAAGNIGAKFMLLEDQLLGSIEFGNFSEVRYASILAGLKHHKLTGQFEVTFGTDPNNRIVMAMSRSKRSARAAIYSDYYGDYEMDMNDHLSSGALVLTTSAGLHKVWYEFKTIDGYEVTMELESPLLTNGKAIGKIHYNTVNNDYKLFLSSYQEHLLSGSLRFDKTGLWLSANIESEILPGNKFDINMMYQITENVLRSTAACNVVGTKHGFTLLLSKATSTFNLTIASTLLPWNEISLLSNGSKVDKEISTNATLMFGQEEAASISGQLNMRDYNDLSGSVAVTSPVYKFLNFKTGFDLNLAGILNTDTTANIVRLEINPLSGNQFPTFSLVVASVVEDDKKFKTFKINVPGIDLVHGTISLGNSEEWKRNSLEVEVNFSEGEHHAKLSWDFAECSHISASLAYNNHELDRVFVEVTVAQNAFDGPRFILTARSTSTWQEAEQAQLTIISKFGLSTTEGDLAAAYTWNNLEGESSILYKLAGERKELRLLSEQPITGFGKLGITLAYENTATRKTGAAHVTYPTSHSQQGHSSFGVELDFKYESVTDFLVLVNLDIPIEGLYLTKVHMGNTITDDYREVTFGGRWKDVNAHSYLKFGKGMTEVFYSVEKESKFITSLHLKRQRVSSNWMSVLIAGDNIFLTGYDVRVEAPMDPGLVVEVDSDTLLRVRLTRTSTGANFLITGIDYKISGSGVIDNSQRDSIGMKFNLLPGVPGLPNGLHLRLKQLNQLFNFQSAHKQVEQSLELTWPNGDSLKTQLSVETDHERVNVVMRNLQNGVDVFGFHHKTDQISEEGAMGKKRTTCITLPSHRACQVQTWKHFDMEDPYNAFAVEVETTFGRKGEPAGSGATFSLWVNQSWEAETKESGFQFTKLLDSSGSEAMLTSYYKSVGQQRAVLGIKSFDPRPLDLNFDLMVTYENFPGKENFPEKSKKSLVCVLVDTNGRSHSLESSFALDYAEKSVLITVDQSPKMESYRLSGQLVETEDVMGVELLAERNRLSVLGLDAKVNNGRSIAVDTKYRTTTTNEEKTIGLVAGMNEEENRLSATFTTKTNIRAEQSADVNIQLSDDGDNLLVQVNWPPAINEWASQEIKAIRSKISDEMARTETRANYQQAFLYIEKFMNITYNDLIYVEDGEEIYAKYEETSKFLVDKLTNIATALNINSKIHQEFTKGIYYLADLCAGAMSASLELRKLVLYTESGFNYGVLKFVRHQLEHVTNILADIKHDLLMKIHNCLDPEDIEGLYQEITESVPESVKVMQDEVIKVAVNLSKAVKSVKRKIWEYKIVLTDFMSVVRKSMKEVSHFLHQFKAGREIVQFYYDYQSWFEELHLSQQVQRSLRELEGFMQRASVHFEDLKRCLEQAYRRIVRWTLENYQMAERYPPVAFLMSATESVFGGAWNLVKMYNERNHPQIIRLLQRLIGKIDAVTSSVVRFLDVYVYQVRELVDYQVTYKPDQGHFAYEQLLPFTWYAFTDTPDVVKLLDLLEDEAGGGDQVNGATDFDLIKFQYDLLDAINTISGALSVQTLIPPFSASAIIAGNSHIKTFDGKVYEFTGAGGCSYLLTADFLYKRFSVIANYDGMRRTSVSVTSDNHMIEINEPQGDNNELIKITLDKRNVELPIAYDHTLVKREGATVIVENDEGMRLVCNMAIQLCSVTISGWYYGKTGGLLGIYDNEPSNDWMTPEREVVDNLKQFAKSWQMTDDSNAHCPVKEPPTLDQATAWEREACEEAFVKETSQLRPCFSSLDPSPYLKMCLKDIQKVRNRPDKMATGICLSSAAYVEECRVAGVALWVPYQCVNCTGDQGQLMVAGEDATFTQGQSETDVVFLIERKSTCPSNFYQEQVSELTGLIDRQLESQGTTNNRFGIVGFGGKGQLASPHLITSGSKIMSTAEHATTSLKAIYKQDGEGASDVFSALKYAVDLPYRPGAGKTVVLVTCDGEGHDDGSFYGDAMTILQLYDVTLHHLTPVQFTHKGFPSRTKTAKLAKKVYGFDKHVAYTADGGADKGLRRQLWKTKDFLSTLAMENGGVVFDSQKLDKASRTVAKRAANVISSQVALKGKVSECQACHCWADSDGQGRLKCQKCILPVPLSLKFKSFQ